METQSSLPEPWVDRIFDKMAVTYGSAWLNKWEGLDIASVKANWGHELRGFQQSPQAIKYALEHLPSDFPPTVLQFRDMCIRRPESLPKQLPAPKADDAVVKAVVGGLKRSAGVDPKEWAYRLQERIRNGAKVTIAQRDMVKAALKAPEGDAA